MSVTLLISLIIFLMLIMGCIGRKCGQRNDRQGNVFTVHDEASRDSRYNDIFYIEPNSAEAARIRAQLEKDDKDLPSYDEVVRMTNLTQPTAAPASVTTMTASNASVNTTDTILSVPPYSEVDPYASTSSNATATTEGAATLHITSPPPALPTSLTNVNGHHSAAAAVVALPITTHTSSNV